MICNPPRLIIDTNVWLDYFFPKRPRHGTAKELVERASEVNADMLIPATSAKDVFFVGLDTMKDEARADVGELTEACALALNEIAWGMLDSIRNLATIVGTDAADAWLADKMKDVHRDYEDDLVLAAALRAASDYLVTNDKKLLKHAPQAGVAALSSADALALLDVSC